MLVAVILNQYVLSTTKQFGHAASALISVTWVRDCVGKPRLTKERKW